MNKMNEVGKRTLVLKKTFNAPIKLVWEAWTQPEHIVQWWAPKGMKIKVIEHDFKIGGKWKYVMPMPDGNEFISDGEYLEIVEFKKIFTTANFKEMTEGEEIRVLFEEKGDQNNDSFSVIVPSEDYCYKHENMNI